MRKGFTLIELLVVVLIIGILAAIAVPKYQKAVLKSKIASDLPLLVSVINAQKVYEMANGKFALNLDELDVSLPCQRIQTEGDGSYCTLPSALLKTYNRSGVYIERGGLYRLQWSKTGADQKVLCIARADNQQAKEVCASYGGTLIG